MKHFCLGLKGFGGQWVIVEQPKVRVRAGLFEIDLRSGELYKSGRRVALQQLPFRVLSVLIERPGELVTREELHSQLWPSDTYVAFDEGLNTAIRKLRAAFGDSADNPRFIETIPRRGYRFIAPLARDAGNSATAMSVAEANQDVAAPASSTFPIPLAGEFSEELKLTRRKRKSLPWIAGAVLLSTALLLAWEFRPTLPSPHVIRIRQMTRLGNAQPWTYSDGLRIYFSFGPADDRRQWRSISVEGGESTTTNEIKAEWIPQSFSPNGSELLILNQRKLAPFWKVYFPSGSMQQLDPSSIAGPHTEDGVWSPDGQNIAFVADAGLFLMKSDGSDAHKAATFKGDCAHPIWSPDGRKIRVTVLDSALWVRTVMEVDVASGATHEVRLGVDSPRAVGWLHGGDYFLFTTKESGLSDLWAIRETPAGLQKIDPRPVRLTAGPISFDSPLIGRDGKTIFVVGIQPRGAMQQYNKAADKFEPFLGGLSGDHISYSTDGQWFAYIAYPEGTLWRCRANGQDCMQLAFMSMRMDLPTWSPDGKMIAFHAKGAGKVSKGYIISANGGTPQLLLPESAAGEDGLHWSPDGERIMFNEISGSQTRRLRILDLKTRKITDVPDFPGFQGGSWSPDGNYIVARDQDGIGRLFNFRMNRWTSLNQMNGDCWWSADSQYIYFHNLNHVPTLPKQDGLFRLRISDNHIEKIMPVPLFKLTGTWGIGTGMTPDGTPLVMQDLSTSDLYALDLDLP